MPKLFWLSALVATALIFGCGGDEAGADACRVEAPKDELYVYFAPESFDAGVERLSSRFEVVSVSEYSQWAKIRVAPERRDRVQGELANEDGVEAVAPPTPFVVPQCLAQG